MKKDIAICWFRQDLRLSDNPALCAASKHAEILPIYIYDDTLPQEEQPGGASKVWLHHSLVSLSEQLNGKLGIYSGTPETILQTLIDTYNVSAVYWNRCYEPGAIARDTIIKDKLSHQGITAQSHNASLLWEPWTIAKADGTPYKVFTPYYRKGCLHSTPPRTPLQMPDIPSSCRQEQSISIEELDLLPTLPWAESICAHWNISEQGAHDKLKEFIEHNLHDYKEGRDYPDRARTSQLSPYLHHGQISPHQIWDAIRHTMIDEHHDTFCSELGWREFSYSLLYYNPKLQHKNLQEKFDAFSWNDNPQALRAWQQGNTGIPIVDAGMRELWQTGYMHNRVRMIVGSFLVKNLRLHWHHGERWFWDCLVDADFASNSASWQWIAGCGADAAPYFRIFNPVTQSEKFDSDGAYIRHYVPEIATLPDKYLFKPWEAPSHVMLQAKVHLGSTYPHPIVDLKESRKAALDAFQDLKKPFT